MTITSKKWFKPALISFLSLSVAANIFVPIYFTVIANHETYHDYHFKYWNDCEAINKLKSFVKETVIPNDGKDSKGRKLYVPKEDRIATFDMDGTLFGERSPIYLEWMMYADYYLKLIEEESPKLQEEIYVPNQNRYSKEDYPIFPIKLEDVDTKIKEFMAHQKMPDNIIVKTYPEGSETKCEVSLEIAEAYAGAKLFSELSLSKYNNYVNDYLDKDACYFSNMKYKDMYYRPMQEVVEFLQLNNFDVYTVSGTDRYMVRDIVHNFLNLQSNKVIGMDVSTTFDEGTGETIRGDSLIYKNVEKVKPELIMQEIGKKPILSFGNSSGDIDMHKITLSNDNYHSDAFMVVADDVEREYGYEGEELEERIAKWIGKYELFSMKNDWKTIYGDNVKKTHNPKQ